MTVILFTQIVFVCLLGAMSPGPSMVVVVNNAIFKNKFNGILTAFGHGFGIGIYALFAVLGISLIIETNLMIFNTIKILSIIFLLYLGIQSFFNKTALNFDQNKMEEGVSLFRRTKRQCLILRFFYLVYCEYSQFISIKNDIFLIYHLY